METILVKAAGLALVIFSGYALKLLGVFRVEDAKVLSRVVVNLTLPAALITGFRSFQFDVTYLSLIAIALVSNLLMLVVGLWWSRSQDASMRALWGLNVCSYNIGCFVLPFVQSFLPAEALICISMFDAGNCPVNSGIAYAVVSANSNGERVRARFVLDKLRHSVPFMTYLILMVLSMLRIKLPEVVYQITSTVSGANTFVAMLMLGILFEVRVSSEDRRQITKILVLRYMGSFIMAALVWLSPLPLLVRQVSVMAMMAPIPSVTMVYCEKCGCKPSLYGVLNSISLAISLVLTFSLLLVLHL